MLSEHDGFFPLPYGREWIVLVHEDSHCDVSLPVSIFFIVVLVDAMLQQWLFVRERYRNFDFFILHKECVDHSCGRPERSVDLFSSIVGWIVVEAYLAFDC